MTTESPAPAPRLHNLPRFVRPSFLTATIDGRAGKIAAGPKSRDGCLELAVAIRINGGIVDDYVQVIVTPRKDGATSRIVVRVLGNIVYDATVTQ